MRTRLSLALLALTACKPLEQPLPGGEHLDGPTAPVLDRALALETCRGFDGTPELSGAWIFAFETAATVGGTLPEAQPEVVTRYGVATVCQDGTQVAMTLLVCNLAQTPVFDESRTCAAQLPSTELLARLPAVRVYGTLGDAGPEATLVVEGWSERWGLADGAAPPPEPAGVEPVVGDALVDQDEDGEPGVTLRGDSSVPTIAWAARLTEAGFALTTDGRAMVGTTRSSTAETIVGGPASRLLRGRTRRPREGGAVFLRADGRFGTPRLDANQDGAVSCREMLALAEALPAPAAAPCTR